MNVTRKKRLLRGTELRYVLTRCLFQLGPMRVPDLIDELDFQDFGVTGRASKTVSDALRWEMSYGRVRKLARGKYGPGAMPNGTEHRIISRVLSLQDEAAALNADADSAFWDAY